MTTPRPTDRADDLDPALFYTGLVAELYGPLNLANDPQLEIRKIEWLVAQSILTREQADQQIAQVHSAHAPHSKA